MKRMLMALAIAGVLMLAAGCGGGGSKGGSVAGMPSTPTPTPTTPTPEPEPTPEPVTGLPEYHTLETGTIRASNTRIILEANGMRTTVTCPPEGDDCMVTVASDGTATFTGGRPTVVTEPYLVSSVDWPLREPLSGWYTTEVRESRDVYYGYENYSWWGQLRSSRGVLGYYGLQSRPDGSIQPWFMRRTDQLYTGQPRGSTSATWRGNFLGYAFGRSFGYTDEGWARANDIEARLADTGTLTVGGTEVPFATKLIGDVAMTATFSPGSTTVDWSLSNSRTPTGGAFGPSGGQTGILTLTNLNRNYSSFPVNPDGTFSSSGTNPYVTKEQAAVLQARQNPGETFEISGTFVGSGGHGVLGTISTITSQVYNTATSPPPNYITRTWGLRGAFGAIREE